MPDLSRDILRSAVVLGGVGFAAGYVGPLLLSTSNLGPLLGIFVTGPVGALAGAMWGLVRAASGGDPPGWRAVALWLAAIWAATLLYSLFLLGLSPQTGVPAVGLQVFVLLGTALLLRRHPLRRAVPLVLVALALIPIASAFPPVTRSRWGAPGGREPSDSEPLPSRAFLLDRRFDASRHAPVLAVDWHRFTLEWMVAGGAAVLMSGLLLRGRRRIDVDARPG